MKKIILFFIICTSLFSSGIGDMEVNVTIIPTNKTKKYNLKDKLILDAGTYNSLEENIFEHHLATVVVKMSPKKNVAKEKKRTTESYCILDSEFNVPYKLNYLFNGELSGEIALANLKNYYNGANSNMILREKNFKKISIQLSKTDEKDEYYTFSAYPDECIEQNGTNIVSYLEYSFELYLDILSVSKGTIIGKDVLVKEEDIETAIGSIDDVIKNQFLRMQ